MTPSPFGRDWRKRFGFAHEFKFAAMPNTFNFPTQPFVITLMSPRV